MVELAHHDSSIGEEPLGQRGDPTVDTDRQRAFLKVDGSVARYQAFELAPTHKTKDSMPLSAAESNTGEQSHLTSQRTPVNTDLNLLDVLW